MIDLSRLGPIDWGRLAFPQDDGYDTAVFAEICRVRYGWEPIKPEGATWLDGRCKILPMQYLSSDSADVPIGDERWQWAAELCATWPAQYEQIRQLVNELSACYQISCAGGRCGTYCGPRRDGGNPFVRSDRITAEEWGCVWAAMDSGSGYCEGISHELGHWKGYALGVFIEDWEPVIFANPSPAREAVENAPGRYDLDDETRRREWNPRGIGFQPFNAKLRPIGAMFQEQWICLHMIRYHINMLPTIEDGHGNEADVDMFLDWARFHLERTKRGHEDMENMAVLVPGSGESFFHGYCSWAHSLFDEARHTFGRPTS